MSGMDGHIANRSHVPESMAGIGGPRISATLGAAGA